MARLLADAERLTGIKYDINNLDDVFNAIHVIQTELGITGTTAKEASETLTGSFAAMKASAQDFLGNLALGMDIKEPLSNLITTTGTFLFGNLIPMIINIGKALPGALVQAISEVGPVMVEQGKNLMANLGIGLSDTSPLNGIGDKLKANLMPVFESLKTSLGFLPELFKSISDSVLGVIEIIADGLTRLDFSGIASLASAIIPAITNAFQTFSSIVGPAVQMVVDSFVGLWNAIQPVLSILASSLMPIFNIVASFLGGVFKGVLLGVAGTFDILKVVIEFLTPVFNALVSVLDFISPVLSKIAEWVGVVIGIFASLGGSSNSLKDIIKSGWKNIHSAISKAVDIVKGAVNGGINIFNTFKTVGNSLRDSLKSAWNAISGAVKNAKGSISGSIEKIKSIFNSLKNIDLFEAGKAIIDSFLRGLKNAFGAVKNFVGGIASWIREHKGPISYDRKLLIPAGKAIIGGLNKSMVESFKDVKSNVLSMAGEIYDSFDVSPKPIVLVDGSNIDRYKATIEQRVVNGNINVEDYRKSRDEKVDGMLLDILTYLKLLSEKDSDVYIDGEKASSILSYKIDALRAKKDKYEKRRGGVLV